MSHTGLREIFGTSFEEDLIGSRLVERIYGFGGRDRIYAGAGDDFLFGGAGDDLLDGGEGADVMFGGSGNDTYRVDNAGDIVTEESTAGSDDGGVDYVQSTITYTLGRFIEKLELTGTADIDGAGNELDNVVKGNAGNNVVFGGSGSDIIYGYDGDDVLIGGLGRDYLTGGFGADTFVLQPEANAWDRIYDFEAQDQIGIFAAAFGLTEGAGLTNGELSSRYFVTGTAATAVGHGQFVYRADRATLLWDPDGAGSAGAFTLALLQAGATVTASQFRIMPTNVTASAAPFQPEPIREDSHKVYFDLNLSGPLETDVILTVSTIDGAARGGQDYVALASYQVTIAAGSTTAYVAVDLIDDDHLEGMEQFQLRIDSAMTATGTALAIDGSAAAAQIMDEGPSVIGDHLLSGVGSTDPSGIAYDARNGTFFISDSEVDEAPFSRANNLFKVGLDGSFVSGTGLGFTAEPTGLAIDSANRKLFIADDDQYKVFVVETDNPGRVSWSFDTKPLGGADPEDIAFNLNNGRLFIVNGDQRTIIEIDQRGNSLFSSILLPDEIKDPEALAYDAREDVFYVGGGFSSSIWKVDRSGNILDTITALEDARNAENGHRVNVKDLELAPASDGSGEIHLYVADYGWSHVDDGRLIELDLGDTGAGWLLV